MAEVMAFLGSPYTLLVGLVLAERLIEVLIARRNLRLARVRGGFVAESRSLFPIAVFQAVWLFACPLEVFLLQRPWMPSLGIPTLALVGLAMALRYWAVATLGDRWNIRTVIVPGEGVVTGGPYRFVRHPNYLALMVETVALPLVHSAWLTGWASCLVFPFLLAGRIRAEEAELIRHTDYGNAFAGRGRLLP
jgi:methyltransferase